MIRTKLVLIASALAGGFKAGIKLLMKAHGFNNQQEIYQNLMRNLLAAGVIPHNNQNCHYVASSYGGRHLTRLHLLR